MSVAVFRADGIYWAPGPCSWLSELRRRRDDLLAALRVELVDTERARLLEALDLSRIGINSHIEICEECRRWLAAIETGQDLVQATPEEEAKFWQNSSGCNVHPKEGDNGKKS